MAGRRVERVERAIREAVCEVLVEGLNDPRAGFITVTRVEASPDLRQAKVFFSAFGTESQQRLSAQCLAHARGYIQREVGRRLPLRFCPTLVFREDREFKEHLEVQRLIAETRRERMPDDQQQDRNGNEPLEPLEPIE